MNKYWTDDDCQGFCRCPECGGSAFWSYIHRQHRCETCEIWFSRHDRREDAAPGAREEPPAT